MKYKLRTKTFVGDDEKKIVKQFHKFLKDNFEGGILSGFQIVGFDIPLILSRFIKYKLPPLKLFGSQYEYLDARLMLGDSRTKGTLQDYLTLFGMEGKFNSYNGSDVQKLWLDGNWKDIRKYVAQDSKIEHKLTLAILDYYKKSYDIESILTFDLEVVAPIENIDLPKLESEEVWTEKKLDILRKKYAKESTVQSHFTTDFSYEEEIKKHEELVIKETKNAIFDRFRNKIIAIGCSWSELVEEEETF